ncbi:MAG TPA: hypothetical protein DCS88_14580 [Alphaproteobacteria bacterium]|nr:hypothetical protein [Alphaproteobacteria bacterium]
MPVKGRDPSLRIGFIHGARMFWRHGVLDSLITTDNFSDVRHQIQVMIDQYRINAEKWVVDQFNDIPDYPADGAVVSLRLWMEKFLTARQQADIFEGLAQKLGLCQIPLSQDTVRRLEAVRGMYQLRDMEETVIMLLDAVRCRPTL